MLGDGDGHRPRAVRGRLAVRGQQAGDAVDRDGAAVRRGQGEAIERQRPTDLTHVINACDRPANAGARDHCRLITADQSPRIDPTAEVVDRGYGEARKQAGPQEAEQNRAIGADQRVLSVEMTGITNHDATPNSPGCNELIGV